MLIETDPEELAKIVIHHGLQLHRQLGPGLMESVYETVFADQLRAIGLEIECQKPIDIQVNGRFFANAFRADIIVNRSLLLELKSVENLASVHLKQALTYIRLLNMPLGLILNFGAATFREGTKRVMNDSAKK